MGKPGPKGGSRKAEKRPWTDVDGVDGVDNQALLDSNPFATLPEENGEKIVKKEKLPPFYVKGQPRRLLAELNKLVEQGLKAEFRLCTDGVKITVPSAEHYQSVEQTLQVWRVEYFTHDLPSKKPFKVVIRGLYELETSEVEEELKRYNLHPVKVFKITRHNDAVQYRDQLYLVHLEGGSTNMKELQKIRGLFNVIVQWERYKPVHRDVTQCTNCLNFGHGTRNCHLKTRCAKCGQPHATTDCPVDMTDKVPVCVNCEKAHTSTSRSCPKRAQFIEQRKKASQPRQPKKPKPEINLGNGFPGLPTPPPRPPGPGGQGNGNSAQAGSNTTPPGFGGGHPGPVPSAPPTDGLTQVLNTLTSVVSKLQEMMVQMMRFMMNAFNVHSQRP